MSEKKRKSPFAGILIDPYFERTADLQPVSGERLQFTCDSCQKVIGEYVVYSFSDPVTDLCVKCYNELRMAATDPAVLKAWKETHEKTVSDFLIKHASHSK